MFISIVAFILVSALMPADAGKLFKIVVRLLLIPVIAGISYEVLRLAGKNDSLIVRMISAPGMALQKLTTKEPDDSMIEVAISAVEAVFDWKAFLEEEKTENEEEPVEEVKEKVEDEIEILSIDDEDDEEKDEILNALDRYFEASEPSDEEKKESDT